MIICHTHSTRRSRSVGILSIVLATSACGNAPPIDETRDAENSQGRSLIAEPQPAGRLILTPTLTLGNPPTPGDTAVIGKPRAVIEVGHSIYILDSDLKKILVFASDGTFEREIGRGYGIQPGQFALPVDMAFADGRLYVLDYELKRVSGFDTTGHFVKLIELTNLHPRAIAVGDDGLYVRFMSPRAKHWAARVDSLGKVLQYVFPVDQSDAPFIDAGYGGALSVAADRSAVSYVHSHGTLATTGGVHAQLLPVPRLYSRPDGSKASERVTYDAAGLGSNRLALLQAREPMVKGGRTRYEIAVFSHDRTFLGRYEFPLGTAPLSIDRGSEDDVLNVSFLEQTPKVIRYKVKVLDE